MRNHTHEVERKPPSTIPELLCARATRAPDGIAFSFEDETGWQTITWSRFWQRVQSLARGLRSRGMVSGDHVGILAPTSLSWELMQHAVMLAGGVVVGLEPHDTADRLRRIVNHAEVKLLVVGSDALLAKLAPQQIEGVRLVVCLTATAQAEQQSIALTFEALEREGHALGADPAPVEFPAPDTSAVLVYTSGTTGEPKGILYRHEQVVLAVRAIVNAYPEVPEGARFVCWLPLANLFQRIMNLAAMEAGGRTFLVSDPLKVLQALPVARPDVFIGVPRFYEKLHAGIEQEIGRKSPRVQRFIRWAIAAGDRYAICIRGTGVVSLSQSIAHLLADKLVLRKLRAVLGGRVRFMVTGSAPTPMRLLDFFASIGLPLYEAYGMSENVVPVALNRPREFRFGTVGRPLPESSVALDADGELLVKGDGVFCGYFRDEGRSQSFTDEGYYRTGDYASLDADGYLTLLGRKSEIIKTSTGRRISPIGVEAALQVIPYVDRVLVVGAGRKCLSAIFTLEMSALRDLVSARTIAANRELGLPLSDEVLSLIRADVATATVGLAEHERPAGCLVLTRAWTIEDGELTPNLKLKRRIIERKLSESLDDLYTQIERSDQAGPVIRGPGSAK